MTTETLTQPPGTQSHRITTTHLPPALSADALFAALYQELRRLSRYHLSRDWMQISMSATTLLHNAYVDMAGRDTGFESRQQFVSYASRVMRGLIVDHVRRRCALKRMDASGINALDSDLATSATGDRELLLVSDALDELGSVDPALVEVVNLKYFCGFSFSEIGTMQGVSERTVQRAWEKARIYLHRSIRTAN
jgi:RNA polymerase sigma factor (TIGR02999 family)